MQGSGVLDEVITPHDVQEFESLISYWYDELDLLSLACIDGGVRAS